MVKSVLKAAAAGIVCNRDRFVEILIFDILQWEVASSSSWTILRAPFNLWIGKSGNSSQIDFMWKEEGGICDAHPFTASLCAVGCQLEAQSGAVIRQLFVHYKTQIDSKWLDGRLAALSSPFDVQTVYHGTNNHLTLIAYKWYNK